MNDKPHVHELKAADFIVEAPAVDFWRPLDDIRAGIEGPIVVRGTNNSEHPAIAIRGRIQYLEPLPVDFQAVGWRQANPKPSPHP